MLSKKAKYALQACLALATKPIGKPTLIADIAEQDGIPKKFLEIILLDLRNAGILASRKGKGGGYSLARAPQTITVGQIVRLMDGSLAPIPCVSKSGYQPCTDCRDERTCGIRMIMKDVGDATAEILDRASLQDLLDRVHQAEMNPDESIHWVI
jgi:Rrf2 family protein